MRILEAARAVCARRGFDGARMEEIAAEAHVSKGTLYRFFDGKEDLFLATVLQSYEETDLFVSDDAKDLLPMARLESLLRAMALALPTISAHMPVNFQAWGVVVRDAAAREKLCEALRRAYAASGAELEAILRDGQRRGAFRTDTDPVALATTLLAVFDGFVYRSAFDPENATPERLLASFAPLLEAVQTGAGASFGKVASQGGRRV